MPPGLLVATDDHASPPHRYWDSVTYLWNHAVFLYAYVFSVYPVLLGYAVDCKL